ncbi:MAG: hypothetical protein BGO52_11585 [Sphingobacteriales bacterium 44-61]|nr:MAG: hypothetical protein BGO52_11585 [Sphingobacteriales bacterium 44-61]
MCSFCLFLFPELLRHSFGPCRKDIELLRAGKGLRHNSIAQIFSLLLFSKKSPPEFFNTLAYGVVFF